MAGEPCVEDADCQSKACASTVPGGVKVCQLLGGCRSAGEVCTVSGQCCSYRAISDGGPDGHCLNVTLDEVVCHAGYTGELASIKRCVLQSDAKEVGKVCAEPDGTPIHNCCDGQSGQDKCKQTAVGVYRCEAADFDPNNLKSAGEDCAMAEECESGVCTLVEDSVAMVSELQCASGCLGAGSGCQNGGDCCSGICVGQLCVDASETGPSCRGFGASCTAGSECCSGFCNSNNLCGSGLI